MASTAHTPSERLRPFIRSITIQESTEPATIKVLPDTSIVMGFQYKGRVAIVDAPPATLPARTSIPLSTAGITGILDTWRVFAYAPDTGTILIRFTPTGAAHFFTTPLHELYNGSFSLTDLTLSSEIAAIETRLAEATTNIQRFAVIETWLQSRLLPKKTDTLILEAIRRISTQKGQLRIATLCKELFISQSQFEKRFRRTVGTTPKKFASLIRLQQVIREGANAKDLTALSYEAGYFDQAHFIHDFTTLTGDTPTGFFAR